MTRPTILDLDLVVVPSKADVGMLGAWYRYKSGHRFAGEEPARDTSDVGAYAAMLSASPYPTAWDDVRKYVEWLEERLRSETFRADVNDKILTKHFEASQAKSVEIQNLKAYIDKTAKDVAETITEIRKRDVSVEQRMRAEAAESRIAELEKRLADAERLSEGMEAASKLTFAAQHNPNCPSPWLVRLVGPSGRIDLKPYGNGFPMVKHETEDVLGFGKTFGEAFRAARAYMEGK